MNRTIETKNLGPIVVKIGGSTLGEEDTSLQDIVELHRRGEQVIVVHGGGAMINDWLHRLEIPSIFIDGLRETNEKVLEVVVAILRGVLNTHFVATITQLGGRAIGLSGVDSSLIQARRLDQQLGLVGEVTGIDTSVLHLILEAKAIPVIAPIGIELSGQSLNINADAVAGEIARAVGASWLIFLSDVDGVLDESGKLLKELTSASADALRHDGTLTNGMIPKIDSALRAAQHGTSVHVINGRLPHTLEQTISGNAIGTRIGG